MGILRRIFQIGKAETNSMIGNMEDPIKMIEQGILDLQNDLQGTIDSLAQVQAIAIKTRREADQANGMAKDYGMKAETLVKKGDDTNAGLALQRQGEKEKEYARLDKEAKLHEANVQKMKAGVGKITSTIADYMNDLISLRSRQQTAEATKKINKQLSAVDSSGTVAMLKRMKAKVEETEVQAEAYGELAEMETGTDDEKIDAALETADPTTDERLAAMKARLNIK